MDSVASDSHYMHEDEGDIQEIMNLADTLFEKMARVFAHPDSTFSISDPESRLAAQNLAVKQQGFLAELDERYKTQRAQAHANVSEHRRKLNSRKICTPALLCLQKVAFHHDSKVFAMLVAERGKGCPLHVIAGPQPGRTVSAWAEEYQISFCETLSPRIELLKLTAPYTLWKSAPFRLISRRLSLLKEAHLERKPHGDEKISALMLDSLFDFKFHWRKPVIETLVLRNVFVAWQGLSVATSLRTLHIHFSGRPGRGRTNNTIDAALLTLFGECQHLEDLSLTFGESIRGIRDLGVHNSPIPLPSLKHLRLTMPFSGIAALLSHMAIPADLSTLHITCVLGLEATGNSKPRECFIKIPAHPQCLPCLSGVRYLDVDLAESSINASLIEEDDEPYAACLTTQETILQDWRVDAVVTTFQRMRTYCPMPELVELSLTDLPEHPRLQYEAIVLFLRHSPQLTRLSLTSCHEDILHHLILHRSPHSRVPICPRLRNVWLTNMTVSLDTLERLCRSLFSNSEYRLRYSLREVARSDSEDSESGGDEVSLTAIVGGLPVQLWLDEDVRVEAKSDPVATAELTKRGGGDDVYNTCQKLHDSCTPIIAGLVPAAVDIAAKVDVIANLFADAKVDLLGLVGVDVTAQIDAIVAVNVDLIVKLILAISLCDILDLTIFAKIDAFISAYLAVLAKIDADIVVKIGKGFPLLDINLFVTLKLILTAKILGLVSILGL
ncbi:hypothetical protein EIP91_008225 [Steccherinum ochraceum]|uniref:Uncharacterized protein n=1 Tax=Steccherinum ochraceum TaxID=92696 RepID=A0A4R0RKQ8_9APHY|nr:hypothetical protein EIP91_008225 [Steccherinum ochraceum]